MIYPPHLRPLLNKLTIPVTVIDINCVNVANIEEHIDIAFEDSTLQVCVFDATLDPLYNKLQTTDIINSWLKTNKLNGYLLHSGFTVKSHSNLVEIVYPSWLWTFKTQRLPALNLEPKRYSYSCLNRNPQWHRLLFYTMLKKKNILNETIYTFYDRDPYNNRKISASFYYQHIEKLEHYANHCIKNLDDFPIVTIDDQPGENDHSTTHQAYLDAECNLVTESSVEVEFTSEKIWKPIASGQCFHVVGSAGTNAWLNSLGFETFDNSYDTITNSIIRLEEVVNQLNNKSMWTDDNLQKIQHNYELFHSGKVEESLLNNCNITQ